jgi:hypothetical protein
VKLRTKFLAAVATTSLILSTNARAGASEDAQAQFGGIMGLSIAICALSYPDLGVNYTECLLGYAQNAMSYALAFSNNGDPMSYEQLVAYDVFQACKAWAFELAGFE